MPPHAPFRGGSPGDGPLSFPDAQGPKSNPPPLFHNDRHCCSVHRLTKGWSLEGVKTGRRGVAIKAEHLCRLVLPDVRTGLSFQEEIFTLLVPSRWGNFFFKVRVGESSLCSQVLLLPLGVPPMPPACFRGRGGVTTVCLVLPLPMGPDVPPK